MNMNFDIQEYKKLKKAVIRYAKTKLGIYWCNDWMQFEEEYLEFENERMLLKTKPLYDCYGFVVV